MKGIYIFIGVILIIAAGGGYYFWNKKKSAEEKEEEKKDNTTHPSSVCGAWKETGSLPLSLCDKSKFVEDVQTALSITIDGLLGTETKAALEAKGYTLPLSCVKFKELTGKDCIDEVISTAPPAEAQPQVKPTGFASSFTASKDAELFIAMN